MTVLSQHETLQSIHIPRHLATGADAVFFQRSPSLTIKGDREDTNFEVEAEGHVSFATYANFLSVSHWREIDPKIRFGMIIKAEGIFSVIWRHIDKKGRIETLHSESFSSSHPKEYIIKCPWIDRISEGGIFIEIHTTSKSLFTNISFIHTNPTTRPCHLAIVITHFKREEQVSAALERLAELCDVKTHDSSVKILVIDNSKSLTTTKPHASIEVIPNTNLGGSGGFSRGLIEARGINGVTHCLFMDDDASCTVEAVRRAIQASRLARIENTCISGAMFLDERPSVLHEAGAQFDGLWRPLKHHLDVASQNSLSALSVSETIHYGGWWFYMFPIADVKSLPFPFFVRGDDVGFGLTNDFHIVSIPGICSWQQDFAEKHSPQTNYLDARGLLALSLARTYPRKKSHIRKILRHFISTYNDGYLYASAEAAILAANDVLTGSGFFERNPDLANRLDILRKLNRQELARDWKEEEAAAINSQKEGASKPSKLQRNISRLTLGSILLPATRKCKNDIPWAYRGHPISRHTLFRSPLAIYKSRDMSQAITAQRDVQRQLKIKIKLAFLICKFFLKEKSLEKDYQEAFKRITTEKFWKKQFMPATTALK